MMIPSTASNVIPRGLGAVIAPNGSFSYPGWCDWMPGADYFDSCKPATPAQIAASAAGDLAGNADTQANRDAIAQGVYDTIANDCAGANGPEDQAACREYQTALKCPSLSHVVGVGPTGQAICSLDLKLPGGLLLWAVVGVGAFVVLSRR